LVNPQLVEDNGCPISPKAAAVKPDVQKPVGLVVRFFGRRIEKIPPLGIIPFHAHLDL